jgi:outer membrane immunogenic protein
MEPFSSTLNFLGVDMKTGIRNLLLGFVAGFVAVSAAQAADLPPRPAPAPPPVVVAPLFTWTGFYIGGNIGAAWAQGDVTTDFGTTWTRSDAKFIGGGQLGFNYQAGAFVFGVEGDFDFTSGKKSSPFVTVGGHSVQAVGEWNWLTTVAARLGFAWDRALFYGKVGYGWSRTSVNIEDAAGFVWCCGWGNTNSGLLVGGGIEYAFTNNWTAKIEYNWLNLQSRTFTGSIGTQTGTFSVNPDVQMVKAGFNYKFGYGY